MNSYELDQPLDLRLKALNLSRSFHYEPFKCPDQHQNIEHHHHHSNLLTNNLMMAAHCHSGNNNYSSSHPPMLRGYNSNSFTDFTSRQHQQVLNSPAYMVHNQNSSQHQQVNLFQPQPIGSSNNNNNNIYRAHDSQPDLSPQANQYNQQMKANESASHQMRTTNIHCQPLNHHQPHPLSSRLAPSRSVAPTPQQVVVPPPPPPPTSLTIHSQQSSTIPSTTTTAPTTPNRSMASPVLCSAFDSSGLQNSPQNYVHQLPAAAHIGRHRQSTSPQHQMSFSHHQPLPVRSLSMSAQMISTSHMSHMVPPTLTPPSTNTSAHPGQYQLSQSPQSSQAGSMASKGARGYRTTSSSGNDIPHQQLIKLGAAVSQASGSLSSSYDSSISSSSNSNSSSSPLSAGTTNTNHNNPTPTTNHSSSASTSNNNNNSTSSENDNNNNDNNNSASPMTRQHSLVSRYNCKPCGIVFSQPETLRAHQEGYCTKRDRGQSAQIRSQSAVSPTSLQQSATNSNSSSASNRNVSNK